MKNKDKMNFKSNQILVDNDDLIVEVGNLDNVAYKGYENLLNNQNTVASSPEKHSKVCSRV